uniref:Uncharacterized protein n=1 Tax=Romanomermis culicivorax TaxID=13658 RepID=A0A915JLE0_ROMCU
MPPYYTEMPPAAKEFAEHRSVHLRNQLRQDPRLLPEQIDALVAKFCNILTEYYTSCIIRPAADRRLRPYNRRPRIFVVVNNFRRYIFRGIRSRNRYYCRIIYRRHFDPNFRRPRYQTVVQLSSYPSFLPR